MSNQTAAYEELSRKLPADVLLEMTKEAHWQLSLQRHQGKGYAECIVVNHMEGNTFQVLAHIDMRVGDYDGKTLIRTTCEKHNITVPEYFR